MAQPSDDPQSPAPQDHLDSPVSLALARRYAGENKVAVERPVQIFGFDANAPADALFDVIRDEIDHFAAALADHADHRFLRAGEAVILPVAAQQPNAI